MTLGELRKNVGNKKLLVGLDRTLKELKKGNLKEVFLASNVSKKMLDDVEHHAKMFGTKVSKLDITNDEMGVVVKKPFAVSVVCLLK